MIGASHTLAHQPIPRFPYHCTSPPVQKYIEPSASIALVPRESLNTLKTSLTGLRHETEQPEYGFWVEGKNSTAGNRFLALGQKEVMQRIFGDIAEPIPANLTSLMLTVEHHPPASRLSSCIILRFH